MFYLFFIFSWVSHATPTSQCLELFASVSGVASSIAENAEYIASPGLGAAQARKVGDFELALTFIDQMIAIHPRDPKLYMRKADTLLTLERPELAIGAIEKSLELQGFAVKSPRVSWIMALQIKANILKKLGRYQEGLDTIEFILTKLSYQNALALQLQAEIFKTMGQKDSAAQTAFVVEQARLLKLKRMARTLKKQREYERALSVLATLLRADPNSDYAFGMQTSIYLELRDFRKALLSLNRELELRPTNRVAQGLRIHVSLILKDSQAALEDSLLLEASDPLRPFYLATSLIENGQPAEALQIIAAAPAPLSHGLLWKKAQASYQAGQRQNARRALIEILQTFDSIDYRALATLIRISLDGTQSPGSIKPPPDAMVLAILGRLTRVERQRLADVGKDLNDKNMWDYNPVTPIESTPTSLQNSFWSGLNSRPIDGQTVRSTF